MANGLSAARRPARGGSAALAAAVLCAAATGPAAQARAAGRYELAVTIDYRGETFARKLAIAAGDQANAMDQERGKTVIVNAVLAAAASGGLELQYQLEVGPKGGVPLQLQSQALLSAGKELVLGAGPGWKVRATAKGPDAGSPKPGANHLLQARVLAKGENLLNGIVVADGSQANLVALLKGKKGDHTVLFNALAASGPGGVSVQYQTELGGAARGKPLFQHQGEATLKPGAAEVSAAKGAGWELRLRVQPR